MVPPWTSKVTSNKGFGPKFEETVYIYEVNGAKKVKSNAQVAMNKNSVRSRAKSFS